MVESKDASIDKTRETPIVLLVILTDPWFSNIAYFLTYGVCPPNMIFKERWNPRLKATKYVISNGVLYKRGIYWTFLRCLDVEQQQKLLKAYHSDVCGGDFSSTLATFKILRNYFYWLGMFKDAYKFVKNCEKCQLFTGHPQLIALPLRLVVINEPFL